MGERWAELCPGAAPPAEGIVIGADRDPEAHVTMLFLDALGQPCAVAKAARQRRGEAALRREHEMLLQLSRLVSPWVRAQAPRPLALERIGTRLVLVTTPVPGQPMRTAYYAPGHVTSRPRVEADFAAATGWLSALHRETAFAAPPFGEAAQDLWVERVIERYRGHIGWDDVEEDLFGRVRRSARDLRGLPIPLVVSHGDYAIGNIMVRSGRVAGLIDWERGDLARPPFRDIYKFPASYAMYLDRAAPGRRGGIRAGREAFDAAWRRYGTWRPLSGIGFGYFGAGWFPDLVRRFVLGHLDRLGIAHAANAVFFPIFLAEEALALPDPAFRDGYRSALHAVANSPRSAWLWESEVAAR
jgi:aminoglycoside phosphotransferase (APT) family kinase protein